MDQSRLILASKPSRVSSDKLNSAQSHENLIKQIKTLKDWEIKGNFNALVL